MEGRREGERVTLIVRNERVLVVVVARKWEPFSSIGRREHIDGLARRRRAVALEGCVDGCHDDTTHRLRSRVRQDPEEDASRLTGDDACG